ncbi:hypothetical protein Tco_1502766, partial [Tanacetum coccineum]
RLKDIELGQRQLEAESLIASRERAGLLNRDQTITLALCMTLRSYDRPLLQSKIAEAWLAHRRQTSYLDANHTAGLVIKSQSHNEDDGDNGNGGGNGNRNGGGNGNGNPNGNDRGAMPVAHECTYHDFIKCQPLNFKGTKGDVGLTRWFEKIETLFHISNCPEKYQGKYAMFTLLNSALTWWNSHKRTIGADAAFAML